MKKEREEHAPDSPPRAMALRHDLDAVIAVLSPPGAWIQHALACDNQGNDCSFRDARATGFCVAGAILRAYVSDTGVLDYLFGFLGTNDLAEWNDQPGRTQEEVLETLRSARDAVQG